MTWFIKILALSQWSEMDTAVTPRNAYKVKHVNALIRLPFQLVYFLKLSSNWNIKIILNVSEFLKKYESYIAL